MKSFKVSFVIRADRLETIIGLLSNEVSALEMTELNKNPNGFTRSRKNHKLTGAGSKIVENLNASAGEVHFSSLAKLLPPFGLAESGVSPLLSKLVKTGKIKRAKRGYYSKA